MTPYLCQVERVLPRLLALFNNDLTSGSYGWGDRYHWAWKLIDFANGTYQGAANGLARLVTHGFLPDYLTDDVVLNRIHAIFQGTDHLLRRNGSLEEAFPHESSFCVTAVVAYDLLTSIELLQDYLADEKRNSYLNVVRPMIQFLYQSQETHAFISNHLASAAAALYKWSMLTGEPGQERGAQILERIIATQSDEGWFLEYEGADPGYQTLCTCFLADLHRMRPDIGLDAPLRRSVKFLWHFAQPDGSFGGSYGSRNTRFYYPAGIEALTSYSPEAAALANFMRESIARHATVSLDSIDEPNLIPMFNAYCWAAVLHSESEQKGNCIPEVPAISRKAFRKEYPKAGLLVDKGQRHYTVISWNKGGVVAHFPKDGQSLIDAGVVIRNKRGQQYSTQAYSHNNQVTLSVDRLEVITSFTAMHDQLPGPMQFIVLRSLNISLMRFRWVNALIKKLLVKWLITGKRPTRAYNRRMIRLGEDLKISDEINDAGLGLEQVSLVTPFSAIHMASQGYWQRQDE